MFDKRGYNQTEKLSLRDAVVVPHFVLVLGSPSSTPARELFELRRLTARRVVFRSPKSGTPSLVQWTARKLTQYPRVAFILVASLFLLASVRSATAAGLGSASDQTNASSSTSSQGESDVRERELGKPIERQLAAGQHHTYQVSLAAGQFMHVVVEPRGMAVDVILFGPDVKPIMNLAAAAGSAEHLYLIAKEHGIYRIEIQSSEDVAGNYRIELDGLRVAAPNDKSLAFAESAFAQGEQLHKEGTAASKQKAIEKFEQALTLWRTADDRHGVADTLEHLAKASYELGENQKALGYLTDALPLFRAVKDSSGEARTLNDLGGVYDSLGEEQKALGNYSQPLPIERALKDRAGEGETLNGIGAVYYRLGEEQEALDYYHQALPLRRATGDQAGQAQTLADIGLVYNSLGEIERMYHAMLTEGLSPAAALRQSQIEMWKQPEWQFPYYWAAAFVMQGEWN